MKKALTLVGAILLVALSVPAWAATPLVDAGWIKENLGKPGIVFLDARSNRNAYLSAHIPGAVYTDYSRDGWRINKDGIRGLLPDAAQVETLVGRLGIDNDSHVVVLAGGYSAREMAIATRIYWTFKVMGHDQVSILDGGMFAYIKDRRNPLENVVNIPRAKAFIARFQPHLLATADVVRKVLGGNTLIDSRSADQFLGINKSSAVRYYGTLPGAVNVPISWLTVNDSGIFRNSETLRSLYRQVGAPTEGDTIIFCNTGHMSSLGWFVSSEILGNKDARMYDGSLAEWTADPANPMDQHVNIR